MSKKNSTLHDLETLQKQVKAASVEFDKAVMFYEVWQTAMDDKDLHDRLGVSYATNAFRVVVTALRRELLLALTRIWDKPRKSVRMDQIIKKIRNRQTIDLLAQKHSTTRYEYEEVYRSLNETSKKVLAIAGKYERSGPSYNVLKKLRTLRDERLAHYDVNASTVPEKEATDKDIEEFYQDNSELVQLLLGLVTATACAPQENMEIQRFYAKLFWASVRGERTEGHPNYRHPRVISNNALP
jgi:hypothetical protein